MNGSHCHSDWFPPKNKHEVLLCVTRTETEWTRRYLHVCHPADGEAARWGCGRRQARLRREKKFDLNSLFCCGASSLNCRYSALIPASHNSVCLVNSLLSMQTQHLLDFNKFPVFKGTFFSFKGYMQKCFFTSSLTQGGTESSIDQS